MIDIDALLLAVLHDPADDVARLVYADRLDETGGALNALRAEFIRLQIADADPDRQQELAAEWLADWFGQGVWNVGRGGCHWGIGTVAPGDILVTLSRGFISSVITYSQHDAEWTPFAAWEYAARFADAVVDVFTDHPVEWVEVDYDGGQGWRIERSGESIWTADGHDASGVDVLCKSVVGRSAFARDLHAALCSRVTELVAPIMYANAINRRFA